MSHVKDFAIWREEAFHVPQRAPMTPEELDAYREYRAAEWKARYEGDYVACSLDARARLYQPVFFVVGDAVYWPHQIGDHPAWLTRPNDGSRLDPHDVLPAWLLDVMKWWSR